MKKTKKLSKETRDKIMELSKQMSWDMHYNKISPEIAGKMFLENAYACGKEGELGFLGKRLKRLKEVIGQ